MVLFIIPSRSSAQVFSTPPPPPPDPIDTDTTNIPFDGGLSLLLLAGVGYGAKKIRDQRKQKEKGNL
jgi:hypothetical protein